MPAPAPENPKQFFLRTVVHYDRAAGLDAMLERVDWGSASPRQVVFAILGRPPNSQVELGSDAAAPRDHARRLLRSEAFRGRVVRLLLDAFPAKRRLLHVHVPKSAGTHLRATLARQYALIPAGLGDPDQFPEAELFERLRGFLARVRDAEAIVVSGHVPLHRFLGHPDLAEPAADNSWWRGETAPYRFGDSVFAVIRDPEAMAVSHANYVVTRLLADPEQRRPDTRGWLRLLGLDALPPDSAEDRLVELARAVLHDPALTEPDRLCRALGQGTANSVFATLALCDAEISHVDCYRQWLEARWGVVSDKRSNTSRLLLSPDALTPADRARVRALTVQDRIVHDRIRRALDRAGELSVFGPALWTAPEPRRWLVG